MSRKQGGLFLSDKGAYRLKKLINESPLTREEIANEIGYDPQQLYGFVCKGKSQRKMYPQTLSKLAMLFGVSEEYILGDSDYKTEAEARAAEYHKRDDIGFITQSPIYDLLNYLGYEFVEDQCYWEPHSRYSLEELGGEYRTADHTDEILKGLIELSKGNTAPDRGPIYTFKTPSGYPVYIPADTFAATEQLILDLARGTVKNLFEEWIGREKVFDRPPESWLFPYPKDEKRPAGTKRADSAANTSIDSRPQK